MNKFYIIIILISITNIFAVWGTDIGYIMNVNSSNRFNVTAYSSLYPLKPSKRSFGVGVMYDLNEKVTFTGEYYCRYFHEILYTFTTFKLGYTTDDELFVGYDWAINADFINLKFNILQVIFNDRIGPDFGCGITIGIGDEYGLLYRKKRLRRKK